jgi:hypothetical protein
LIVRVSLGLVAVVVIAWLSVMAYDQGALKHGVTKAGTFHPIGADRYFRRARLLNPSTRPDALLALYEAVHGSRQRAIARLEDVLRKEPDDVYVWHELYGIALGHDAAITRRARAALRRLDPRDFPR